MIFSCATNGGCVDAGQGACHGMYDQGESITIGI